MIKVTVYKNQEKEYTGFNCIGHAGYAKAGSDIICAGVSVLVINTVNSIAQLTSDSIETATDEATGRIYLKFKGKPSREGELFMKSFVLGMQGICTAYGNKYISLKFKEV